MNICQCGCGLKCQTEYRSGHMPIKLNLCQCNCGEMCTENFKRGHGTKGERNYRFQHDKDRQKHLCACDCGSLTNFGRKFLPGHNFKMNFPWNKGLTKQTDIRLNHREVSESEKVSWKNYCQCNCGQKCKNKFVLGHNNHVTSWNKNLTKETDSRLLAISNILKNYVVPEKQRSVMRAKTIETYKKNKDEIVRKIVKNRKLTRFPYISINGSTIKMRSSWEILYAEYLDAQKIAWNYEFRQFKLSNGTSYFPDFFLPDLNEYHEIKGYWRSDAKEKMNLFRHDYPSEKLIIFQSQDLKNLGLKI